LGVLLLSSVAILITLRGVQEARCIDLIHRPVCVERNGADHHEDHKETKPVENADGGVDLVLPLFRGKVEVNGKGQVKDETDDVQRSSNLSCLESTPGQNSVRFLLLISKCLNVLHLGDEANDNPCDVRKE